MSEIRRAEEYGIIHIESPKFGTYDFIIDLDDIEKCKGKTWCVAVGGRGDFKGYYYAMSTRRKSSPAILLHRFIMNAPDDYNVDHINGNTLDTRKSNLRLCTFQENCRNRQTSRRNSSGYRGVTWNKNEDKWMAYIHLDLGKTFKNLGYFSDLEEAYQKRLDAEEKYYSEYLIVPREEVIERKTTI